MYGEMALVYDRLMADVPYAHWIKFCCEAFKRYNLEPQTILDLACGSGSIAEGLLKEGYNVIGIDRSAEMLSVAAQRLEPWLDKGKLNLLQQDMRSFVLTKPVDAAVCFLDSLNYLSDSQSLCQTFQRAGMALVPGGLFIADLHTEHKLAFVVGDETFTEIQDDLAYIWDNAYDAENRTINMDLTFFVKGNEGLYRRFEETHQQRWFSTEEILLAVEAAKMRLIGLCADLTWEEPGPESERYFVIAQKV